MRSLLLLLALTACQKDEASSPPPPSEVDPAYQADIVKLCDVLTLSGADQHDEASRMFVVAEWLGNNLTTEAGHDFLVSLQQEPDGAKKAALLRAEAERVGLPPCKLADSWQ